MLDLETLKKKVLEQNPKANISLIQKAYEFAENVHKSQKRESGEPFFEHCKEVAEMLVSMKADSATIAAALLHDTVEESSVDIKSIKNEFGEEVASLVEGITKIDKIHFEDKESYSAENLRKILLATTKDIRVMLIKLIDRMHNMETLQCFRPDKQKRIAQETRDIYAPIAHKLGMWNIKGELEDLSLRYLEPEVYRFLRKKINEKRAEREKKTGEIITIIREKLNENNIYAEVHGRAKYFYSIYKKMKKKQVDFSEIYDLIAIRIITKSIPDCYAALGIIHKLWHPMPKKFKDYISTPKANGYQSLHTVLIGPHGKILEVQIRTEEMHYYAEYGVAAHWKYQGTARDKKFDKKISWLKQLLDWKKSENAKEFIEDFKIDMFQNEIVVFTPKGDPITLPEGSTSVDFAYEIHSNIGNSCSAAKVNDKLVPLLYELKSGDIIEIITKKNAKPSRQWLNFVKTSKARNKIKQVLNIKTDIDAKKMRKREREIMSKVISEDKKASIKLSKCCNPLYGDEIEGYYMAEKKITVHRKSCRNIKDIEKRKKANVEWIKKEKEESTNIIIDLNDRVGILADIMNIISKSGINIEHLHTKEKKEKMASVFINISVAEKKEVEDLLNQIKLVKNVINARIAEI